MPTLCFNPSGDLDLSGRMASWYLDGLPIAVSILLVIWICLEDGNINQISGWQSVSFNPSGDLDLSGSNQGTWIHEKLICFNPSGDLDLSGRYCGFYICFQLT